MQTAAQTVNRGASRLVCTGIRYQTATKITAAPAGAAAGFWVIAPEIFFLSSNSPHPSVWLISNFEIQAPPGGEATGMTCSNADFYLFIYFLKN